MLYPRNFEEKVGFDRVRTLLKEKCEGAVGEIFVDKMRFSDNFDLIRKLGLQAEEFVKILSSGTEFPKNNYLDIGESLKKASIGGTFLYEEEFYDLKKALTTLSKCLAFFEADVEEEYPELKGISQQVEFDRQILTEIEGVIDEKGVMRDNASPELSRIRQRINSEQNSLRKKLDQLLRNFKSLGIAKDGVSATIREGRMVIPIGAEYKRKVKGFIHDTSATGQTVYIEPEEVLNINNEIRELELRERQEIIKILTKLTDKV
ncbi:MAG: endonuclease MutS2, partial [Flammeovirgaceae bacterium]|nr:endonuclease MutS2 [Flammeovirgaceae bacterium]